MHSRWVLMCLAAGVMFGAATPRACAQYGHTMAVVSRQRLYMEYFRTKRAQKKLVERLQLYRREYKDQRVEIEAFEKVVKSAKSDALDPDFTVAERDVRRSFAEKKMLELTKMRNDLQERTQARNKELNNQAGRMRERIMNKLDREIAEYAERKGLLLVFDRGDESANQLSALVYVAPVLDITDPILELLNAGAPAPGEEDDDDLEALLGEERLTNVTEQASDVPVEKDERKAEE